MKFNCSSTHKYRKIYLIVKNYIQLYSIKYVVQLFYITLQNNSDNFDKCINSFSIYYFQIKILILPNNNFVLKIFDLLQDANI